MVDASLNGDAAGSGAGGSSRNGNGGRTGDPIDPINVIIDKLQK